MLEEYDDEGCVEAAAITYTPESVGYDPCTMIFLLFPPPNPFPSSSSSLLFAIYHPPVLPQIA